MERNTKDIISEALKPIACNYQVIIEGIVGDIFINGKAYTIEYMNDQEFEEEGLAVALTFHYLRDEGILNIDWVNRLLMDKIPRSNMYSHKVTNVSVTYKGQPLDLDSIDPEDAKNVIKKYFGELLGVSYEELYHICEDLFDSGLALKQRNHNDEE